jgi:hypothetical protein
LGAIDQASRITRSLSSGARSRDPLHPGYRPQLLNGGGVPLDTCSPHAGHDLCAFRMQDLRIDLLISGDYANCEGPRLHDSRRVRAGSNRACRQGGDPHRRKGWNRGKRLARRVPRPASLDPRARRKMAGFDDQARRGELKTVRRMGGAQRYPSDTFNRRVPSAH